MPIFREAGETNHNTPCRTLIQPIVVIDWQAQTANPRGCSCSFYIRRDLHRRLKLYSKIFTQKYCLISTRTPKNISKNCKFLANVVVVFVFDSFDPSLDPEISNTIDNFQPKNIRWTPPCI